MNDIAEQRPDFFEGEYLSATDLEQLVIYLRDQSARHALGGHSWGVVAGLQILEQTSPSGAVDIYLLPGYAVDGYGRAIVVVNPLRLTVDLFNGQPDGPVQLWLRYDQGQTSAVRPGFEVCSAGDSYTRVAESYALEVGDRAVAQSQSGISVAGEAVDDARTAPRLFDDAGPLICDAAVPFQDLPLVDESSRWLIPLGQVGWSAGTPGNFVALDDDEKLYSRRLRRYLGVVAENLYAADGLIRLRRRATDVPAGSTVDSKLIDDLCSAGSLTDKAHDHDIATCGSGEPTFQELVWVEGRLRVTDDVRILGGRLELRDSSGTNYLPVGSTNGSVPLFLQRTDRLDNLGNDNADLAVIVGKADVNHNRFLIQRGETPTAGSDPCAAVQFSQTTLVAVQDDGKVGIGTDKPNDLLDLESTGSAFIHVGDSAPPSEIYLGASDDGGVIAVTNTNDLRIRSGGTDPTDDSTTQVTVTSKGQVGIGTSKPAAGVNNKLTLEGKGAAYMIARDDQDKHEILVGANGDGALVAANVGNDDLILGSNGNTPQVWIKASGNVGIGTDSPDYKLRVEGTSTAHVAVATGQGGHKLLVGVDSTGALIDATGSDDLQLQTGDKNRVVIKSSGKVGIGTDGPNYQLDVRGDIALGNYGQYLAVGSSANIAIVAATWDGTNVSPSVGCTVTPTPPGVFYVKFAVPFTYTPTVTVTINGAATTFLAPLITAADQFSFTLTIWDYNKNLVDAPFSFIAIGGK